MANIVIWVGSDTLGENEAGCGKRCPKELVLSGKFSVGIAEGTETHDRSGGFNVELSAEDTETPQQPQPDSAPRRVCVAGAAGGTLPGQCGGGWGKYDARITPGRA